MNTFDKAFDSFSKYIELTKEEDIIERLEKFSVRNYSGVLIDSIYPFKENHIKFKFRMEIENFGWFFVNSEYFNTTSEFFKYEYFSQITEIEWDRGSPPVNTINNSENLDPQNDFVGFLFKFVQ